MVIGGVLRSRIFQVQLIRGEITKMSRSLEVEAFTKFFMECIMFGYTFENARAEALRKLERWRDDYHAELSRRPPDVKMGPW